MIKHRSFLYVSLKYPIAALLLVALSMQPCFAVGSSFISETNSFGENPATQHGFAWSTSAAVAKSWIEYCPKSAFTSFSEKSIGHVTASAYTAVNDGGKRRVFKVDLSNLQPDTDYIYRLVASDGSTSPNGIFRTAGTLAERFSFLNITDTQGADAKDYGVWGKTLSMALKQNPDARFLVHTGDIVDNGDSIAQWDEFAQAAQGMLLNLPIEPAVGNHDVLNKNKTNGSVHNFTDLFETPRNVGTGTVPGTAYSFDYSNVHIAVMNTECGASNLASQAKWLLQDMKKSNKPWKIVALHRGPYGGPHDSSDIRKIWVPAIDQAGVDLVLEGHDHNYIRTYPMKGGVAVKPGKGTVYIDSNTGGVKDYYMPVSHYWQAVDFQPGTQMYLAVTVDGSALTVKAYDVSNALIDTLRLNK